MEIFCFAYPERLVLLWLVLPLGGILGYGIWRKHLVRKRLADEELAAGLMGSWAYAREIVIGLVQLLSFALLLAAACGPRLCSGDKLVRRESLDMVFVLDVSNSMRARDVSPDRLDRAKEELMRINREYARGRRGLVVFAGSAAVLCPLTADSEVVETMLRSASADLAEAQGTEAGRALDLADRLLTKRTGTGEKPGARIVVLATDGETHGKALFDEAKRLKAHDVKLIIVGVGTVKPSVIPLGGSGSMDSVMTDNEGKSVLTVFRPERLGALARDAGGVFLHSHGAERVSDDVLDLLETIGTQTMWVREPRYREDIYHYAVLLSVLLLFGARIAERMDTGKKA